MKRVVLGISGGVDSAVSAYLLKKRGFDVHGVFMINWDVLDEGTSKCTRSVDEVDARRICDKLSIPFSTVNFVKEYWNQVFEGMLDNYRKGRTVVPDIECNKSIKFNHFHKHAVEQLGADLIATGHYASTSNGDFQEVQHHGKVRLLTAADPLKDQTFFLSTLNQEQLRKSMFPLGHLNKSQVKHIATQQGFHEVVNKPESMGVCFIGKRKSFNSFMDQYIEPSPGIISTLDGRMLGKHEGIHHFTLGKRVPISSGSHLGYFVFKLCPDTQTVYVVEGSHNRLLYARKFLCRVPEWIADDPLTVEHPQSTITCRIQRTHPPVPCHISSTHDNLLLVTPSLPLRAVADGQMCVFYRNNECLGGGEVERIVETL